MLLLERTLDDAIRIGHDVRIRVLRIGKTRVLLGVQAPRNVSVWRDEIAPATVPPATEPAPASNPGEKFHVLVVEDDAIHAKLVRRVLGETGATQVTVVPSGEAAIERLQATADLPEASIDLVLLDLRLPGASGLDVLKIVRAAGPHRLTPVVVMSCSQADADVADCMQAGANAFVSKANDHDEFRKLILRVVDFWRHARRVA